MDRSKPKSKLFVALTLLASLVASGAEAQKPQCALVSSLGHDDSKDRACGISHEGIKAAIASVMGQNSYVIEQNESNGLSCLQVNFHATSLQLPSGNTSRNHCVVTLALEFGFLPDGLLQTRAPWGALYQRNFFPVCERRWLGVGPTPMQNQLRDIFVQYTETCLLEEERVRK
jgi:hypothetical protein